MTWSTVSEQLVWILIKRIRAFLQFNISFGHQMYTRPRSSKVRYDHEESLIIFCRVKNNRKFTYYISNKQKCTRPGSHKPFADCDKKMG